MISLSHGLRLFVRCQGRVLCEADPDIAHISDTAELGFKVAFRIDDEAAPHHPKILRAKVLKLRPLGADDDGVGVA